MPKALALPWRKFNSIICEMQSLDVLCPGDILGHMVQGCMSLCPRSVKEGEVASASQVGKLRHRLDQVVSNGIGILC